MAQISKCVKVKTKTVLETCVLSVIFFYVQSGPKVWYNIGNLGVENTFMHVSGFKCKGINKIFLTLTILTLLYRSVFFTV